MSWFLSILTDRQETYFFTSSNAEKQLRFSNTHSISILRLLLSLRPAPAAYTIVTNSLARVYITHRQALSAKWLWRDSQSDWSLEEIYKSDSGESQEESEKGNSDAKENEDDNPDFVPGVINEKTRKRLDRFVQHLKATELRVLDGKMPCATSGSAIKKIRNWCNELRASFCNRNAHYYKLYCR